MEESKLPQTSTKTHNISERVKHLLDQMTLSEKIGQMSQFAGRHGLPHDLRIAIQNGKVGSILNEVDLDVLNEIQRIAVEESRLGIPVIIGRDVIHGFQTMLPIPLGQAASWNPDLLEEGSKMAATEAASAGIHWTFAPMVDVTRDPRWGRIAESLGEDSFLCAKLSSAMVRGFQGKNLADKNSIAACAKHFAGYGYSEAGKDYAYVNISENEMRNVVLPPFQACANENVATFMTAFSDINGIPATANTFLLKKILREEWNYNGFVVSDWDSVVQLITHGFTKDEKEAAFEACNSGVDMEMASHTYLHNLENLVQEGRISEKSIDSCVERILTVKFKLGLFEHPFIIPGDFPEKGNDQFLNIAKKAALESCVLLKNDFDTLPLKKEKIQNIAIIGPLADDPIEQMGTWTFDGIPDWCITPLEAIKNELKDSKINLFYEKGLKTSRSKDKSGFEKALEIVKKSDTVIMFMGEEAILSGEAHCRADIDLPGIQNELLEEISKLGKSTILVILAGRPLTLTKTKHYVNSMLYAWHPGTMGGPAISDILFGRYAPSGKLPVTFPKAVGQIPIYYNQRNSGKPATHDSFTYIDDIPEKAHQTSVGNTSFHMDAGFEPLYPFGFGLTYTKFHYHHIWLSSDCIKMGESIEIFAEVSNVGHVAAHEVVQLYIRDLVGSVTRPVKELKGFKKIYLEPSENTTIAFKINTSDLAFFGREMTYKSESGLFDVWIGGDSNAHLKTSFRIE